MTPVRLKPTAPPSRVKHSTTALPTYGFISHKIPVSITNKEGPNQMAPLAPFDSDLCLHYLFDLFV